MTPRLSRLASHLIEDADSLLNRALWYATSRQGARDLIAVAIGITIMAGVHVALLTYSDRKHDEVVAALELDIADCTEAYASRVVGR